MTWLLTIYKNFWNFINSRIINPIKWYLRDIYTHNHDKEFVKTDSPHVNSIHQIDTKYNKLYSYVKDIIKECKERGLTHRKVNILKRYLNCTDYLRTNPGISLCDIRILNDDNLQKNIIQYIVTNKDFELCSLLLKESLNGRWVINFYYHLCLIYVDEPKLKDNNFKILEHIIANNLITLNRYINWYLINFIDKHNELDSWDKLQDNFIDFVNFNIKSLSNHGDPNYILAILKYLYYINNTSVKKNIIQDYNFNNNLDKWANNLDANINCQDFLNKSFEIYYICNSNDQIYPQLKKVVNHIILKRTALRCINEMKLEIGKFKILNGSVTERLATEREIVHLVKTLKAFYKTSYSYIDTYNTVYFLNYIKLDNFTEFDKKFFLEIIKQSKGEDELDKILDFFESLLNKSNFFKDQVCSNNTLMYKFIVRGVYQCWNTYNQIKSNKIINHKVFLKIRLYLLKNCHTNFLCSIDNILIDALNTNFFKLLISKNQVNLANKELELKYQNLIQFDIKIPNPSNGVKYITLFDKLINELALMRNGKLITKWIADDNHKIIDFLGTDERKHHLIKMLPYINLVFFTTNYKYSENLRYEFIQKLYDLFENCNNPNENIKSFLEKYKLYNSWLLNGLYVDVKLFDNANDSSNFYNAISPNINSLYRTFYISITKNFNLITYFSNVGNIPNDLILIIFNHLEESKLNEFFIHSDMNRSYNTQDTIFHKVKSPPVARPLLKFLGEVSNKVNEFLIEKDIYKPDESKFVYKNLPLMYQKITALNLQLNAGDDANDKTSAPIKNYFRKLKFETLICQTIVEMCKE